MHISVQTRAVGHEKVISYPKRRDKCIQVLMEYATPTYVLVNKYTARRLHCRRQMFVEQKNLFFISEIVSACSTRILPAHASLRHMLRQRKLSQRQMRALEDMLEYDFDVEYLPGAKNYVQDALSRRPD
jgi:hypothetical protein